jgi:predicted metal-binding protein
MSCGCGDCECERLREQVQSLMAENAELAAHIAVLVALDEKRHDAEKQFGRQLVEARGRIGDRKVDL